MLKQGLYCVTYESIRPGLDTRPHSAPRRNKKGHHPKTPTLTSIEEDENMSSKFGSKGRLLTNWGRYQDMQGLPTLIAGAAEKNTIKVFIPIRLRNWFILYMNCALMKGVKRTSHSLLIGCIGSKVSRSLLFVCFSSMVWFESYHLVLLSIFLLLLSLLFCALFL